ncbi:hypothetical protein BC937DRAFT_93483 [Endogone sp. FLAS-F59071]|nr:hypothetical protein BC937DRAFT_93483 [Endogone sp. FLAS-F59071]|eukprot:RUS14681.1 hypothetical protein BC937DRAFT_93483 [Endogone sp. FLAS-F59071]
MVTRINLPMFQVIPFIQWQAVIKEAREKNHQHLIAIIDPGVKIEEGYTAYEDGLKRNIFIKYRDEDGNIHNSIGVVWPGKVHFPVNVCKGACCSNAK